MDLNWLSEHFPGNLREDFWPFESYWNDRAGDASRNDGFVWQNAVVWVGHQQRGLELARNGDHAGHRGPQNHENPGKRSHATSLQRAAPALARGAHRAPQLDSHILKSSDTPAFSSSPLGKRSYRKQQHAAYLKQLHLPNVGVAALL